MKQKKILFNIFILLLCFIFSGQGLCMDRGYYLLNGIGISGQLEIGQKFEKGENLVPGKWIIYKDGIRVKVDERHYIVLISCNTQECVAENNIGIGTHRGTVIRRYGAPLEETKAKNGVFYRYHGVGFVMKEERVREIYIFPRFDQAK